MFSLVCASTTNVVFKQEYDDKSRIVDYYRTSIKLTTMFGDIKFRTTTRYDIVLHYWFLRYIVQPVKITANVPLSKIGDIIRFTQSLKFTSDSSFSVEDNCRGEFDNNFRKTQVFFEQLHMLGVYLANLTFIFPGLFLPRIPFACKIEFNQAIIQPGINLPEQISNNNTWVFRNCEYKTIAYIPSHVKFVVVYGFIGNNRPSFNVSAQCVVDDPFNYATVQYRL